MNGPNRIVADNVALFICLFILFIFVFFIFFIFFLLFLLVLLFIYAKNNLDTPTIPSSRREGKEGFRK